MSSRVSVWADPISEEGFAEMILHTSICVEFEEGKLIISYNEYGVTYDMAVRDNFRPRLVS